uniref:Uncharacterized protein n=2 Tax=Helianthus annuus TaxID=4232 RepID=A0A251UUS3_HELAN
MKFAGSTYIDCFIFFRFFIYVYLFLIQFRNHHIDIQIFMVFTMGESSSSYRGIWFCRVMNRADQLILAIPDDAASKLWGVDKGPTNVMIHTEDGCVFNVF